MSKMHNPKRPSLKVIDRAIRSIKSGQNCWSCCALYFAHLSVHKVPDNYELSDSMYVSQYKDFVFKKNNGQPFWWNNSDIWHGYRIEALKAFRQACINAAKEK